MLHIIQKKAMMRTTARQVQPTCGNDLLVDQVATMSSRQYPLHVASSIHLMQPWFHGNITREEAVHLITEQGLVDGCVTDYLLAIVRVASFMAKREILNMFVRTFC